MSSPSRNRALLAAGLAGLAAGGAWLTARRTTAESRERRAGSDRGRPLSVRGADGGYRHVRVHGPDEAPTLVLVHCWTGTQELWHKQVSELAGELRIVTYDLRGHGLSEDARDRDYSLQAMADDLDLVLDAALRPGERGLLVGHSMGAMTIAAWADDKPERPEKCLRGLGLLSTGLEELATETTAVPNLPGPFETFHGQIANLVLGTPMSVKGLPLPLAHMAVASIALGPDARDEDIDLTTRMALDCRTLARAGSGRAMARMSLLHAVDNLTVPTIVVAGERDLMTPIAHAERIEQALPNSLGLRVDPDAGHMTPLEAPGVVNAALRELVAATAAGSQEQKLAA